PWRLHEGDAPFCPGAGPHGCNSDTAPAGEGHEEAERRRRSGTGPGWKAKPQVAAHHRPAIDAEGATVTEVLPWLRGGDERVCQRFRTGRRGLRRRRGRSGQPKCRRDDGEKDEPVRTPLR